MSRGCFCLPRTHVDAPGGSLPWAPSPPRTLRRGLLHAGLPGGGSRPLLQGLAHPRTLSSGVQDVELTLLRSHFTTQATPTPRAPTSRGASSWGWGRGRAGACAQYPGRIPQACCLLRCPRPSPPPALCRACTVAMVVQRPSLSLLSGQAVDLEDTLGRGLGSGPTWVQPWPGTP